VTKRSVIAWGWGGGRDELQKGMKDLFGLIEYFYLNCGGDSWLFIYERTIHMAYRKYIKLFT
jgi:hypothetical protein